jgi:hypothetical protein
MARTAQTIQHAPSTAPTQLRRRRRAGPGARCLGRTARARGGASKHADAGKPRPSAENAAGCACSVPAYHTPPPSVVQTTACRHEFTCSRAVVAKPERRSQSQVRTWRSSTQRAAHSGTGRREGAVTVECVASARCAAAGCASAEASSVYGHTGCEAARTSARRRTGSCTCRPSCAAAQAGWRCCN